MKRYSLLVAFVFSLLAFTTVAQNCQICTYTINRVDTSTYILDSGKTLCIQSSGIVMGKIQLAGGVICNSGTFSPSIFNYTNGDFENYGNFENKVSLVLKNNSHFINHLYGKLSQKNISTSGNASFIDEADLEKKD